MSTLTVNTSPGGGTITGTYTVTTPPPPGGYPLTYLVTKPSGTCGAGFQNGIRGRGSIAIAFADVAGAHLSRDGGKTWTPVRDGMGDANKLRDSGAVSTADQRTWYVAYNGNAAGEDITGAGVTANGILKATLSPSGAFSAWSLVAQIPGGWASAGNDRQALDTKAAKDSGHPRETGRGIELDEPRGLLYKASWDGIWRVGTDGTGLTRIWGAGNSITGMCLDPNDSHVMYVSVDLGPKVGVWRIVDPHSTVSAESGITGATMDYPQDVCAVKVGSQTHVFVATGKAIQGASATWGVAYHPPGAWTSGWRDITGNLVADESIADVRPTGIDVWVNGDGTMSLAASHAYDTTPGGNGSRIWWCFGWSGVGVPSWKRPADATVKYNLGGDGEPWWFRKKQPSFMPDKPGFDSRPCFLDGNTILFAGRSGIARYRRGPNQLEVVNEGLQVTYAWDVVCSRTNALQGVHNDTDWGALRWKDGPWSQPIMGTSAFEGSPAKEVNWGGHVSPDGVWSFASGEGGAGSVKTTTSLFVDNPTYTDETGTGSNQPPAGEYRGCCTWGTGAGMVVLAAHQNGKIYRKVGTGAGGAWTVAAEWGALAKQGRVLFATSGDAVAACNQASGLYRSTSKGASGSWSTLATGSSGSITSGHVKADRVTAGRFWHVRGGGVYRIDAGAAPVRVGASSITQAAWVGCYRRPSTGLNELYVVENGVNRLWRSRDDGATWDNITTQSFRHATGGVVRGGDITIDGVIDLACQAAYCLTLIDPDTAA